MIDPLAFLAVTGQPNPPLERNGQQLIMSEVLALLYPFRRIWIPFPEGCAALLNRLYRMKPWVVVRTGSHPGRLPPLCDAVYFGTPTIVNGTPLFPETAGCITSKSLERRTVRDLCTDSMVKRTGLQRIVCGLGTGDISVEERLEDVGPGSKVVVEKNFYDPTPGQEEHFTDWIIARRIAQ